MKRQKILDMAKNMKKIQQKQREKMLGEFKPKLKKKKTRILSDFEIQQINAIEKNRKEILSEIYQENDINKISLCNSLFCTVY